MPGPERTTVVGVSQRIDRIAERGELRDALDHRMVSWLVQAGCLPVAVPNTMDAEGAGGAQLESWLEALAPGGIVLSGGNDIGEFAQRDATERHLLDWAASRHLPVLGICRGLQLMTVWAGAGLVRVAGHAGTRHGLSLGTWQGEWPETVNSYHNWAPEACPPGFEVLARGPDGSIEAIGHAQLPWQGWMWHPERECPFSDLEIKRFRRLLDAC